MPTIEEAISVINSYIKSGHSVIIRQYGKQYSYRDEIHLHERPREITRGYSEMLEELIMEESEQG